MKKSHMMILALAIVAAVTTSAQARDSFSFGINVGGYGYAPPVVYYAPPPVVYYAPTRYYYAPARSYYYSQPPGVSFNYYNGGHSLHREGGDYYRNHGGYGGEHWRGHHDEDRGRGHR